MAATAPVLLQTRPFDYRTPRWGYSIVNLRMGGRVGGQLRTPGTPPMHSPPVTPTTQSLVLMSVKPALVLQPLELDAEDCPPCPPELAARLKRGAQEAAERAHTEVDEFESASSEDGEDFADAQPHPSCMPSPLPFQRAESTSPTRSPAGLRPAKRSRTSEEDTLACSPPLTPRMTREVCLVDSPDELV